MKDSLKDDVINGTSASQPPTGRYLNNLITQISRMPFKRTGCEDLLESASAQKMHFMAKFKKNLSKKIWSTHDKIYLQKDS